MPKASRYTVEFSWRKLQRLEQAKFLNLVTYRFLVFGFGVANSRFSFCRSQLDRLNGKNACRSCGFDASFKPDTDNALNSVSGIMP